MKKPAPKNLTILKKPITQEHGLGCAVACTAFVLGWTYKEACRLFDNPPDGPESRYYCGDIVQALQKAGKSYTFRRLSGKAQTYLSMPGIIVYVGKTKQYPLGHYLARTDDGQWMNPWANCPVIYPAVGAFEKKLPGEVEYVVFSYSNG